MDLMLPISQNEVNTTQGLPAPGVFAPASESVRRSERALGARTSWERGR